MPASVSILPPPGGAAPRGRPRMRSVLRWCSAGLLAMGVACKVEGMPMASVPPAEAYDLPSDFAGRWRGEVNGQMGTLRIDALGEGRYRGLYDGQEVPIDYVLLLQQDTVTVGQSEMLGNRALFTWQDGHGGRGEGWMLIDREGSALTGESGEQGDLDRQWAFIRAE